MDKRLNEYLAALDEADHEAPPPKALSAEQLKEKIQRLKQRQSQAQERLEELRQSQQSQMSATDADSRTL
jgi:hypothetical protein